MRFDDLAQLPTIAQKTGFSIFELPKTVAFSTILKNSFHLCPNEKNTITIDMIRDISDLTRSKQTTDFFLVVESAETMNNNAANAFLKVLEQPNDHLHIVFLVRRANNLLPTVLSRAHFYYLAESPQANSTTPQTTTPQANSTTDPAPAKTTAETTSKNPLQTADPKIIELAKAYLTATPTALPAIADKIAKSKKPDSSRPFALAVVDAAIAIAHQSYFKTADPRFLTKLDKLLKASAALKQNGHIKLQLIANML